MKTNPKQLADAELLQAQLLVDMTNIDKVLGGLTPNDLRRPELKAHKADLLPRYRGAKQNVKRLRRLVNASSQPKTQPHDGEPPPSRDIPSEVVARLYTLSTTISNGDTPTDKDVGTAVDYMEWAEQFRLEDLADV